MRRALVAVLLSASTAVMAAEDGIEADGSPEACEEVRIEVSGETGTIRFCDMTIRFESSEAAVGITVSEQGKGSSTMIEIPRRHLRAAPIQ